MKVLKMTSEYSRIVEAVETAEFDAIWELARLACEAKPSGDNPGDRLALASHIAGILGIDTFEMVEAE